MTRCHTAELRGSSLVGAQTLISGELVFHPSLVTRVDQSHVRGIIDSKQVKKRTINARSVQPNVHGRERVTPLPSSDR